MQYTKL